MQKVEIKLYGAKAQRSKELDNLLRQACRAAVRHFGHSFPARCDITITDDAGIRQINREHREVDKPTDVLSFPMQEFYRGRPQAELDFDPDSGQVMLGDVVISLERARAQAAEYGHSPERECAYLVVHSVLHLMGFDHVDEGEEKRAMRAEEEAILQTLGLTR